MATAAQSLEIAGKRFVLVPEREYQRMRKESGMPPLPPADAEGYRSAVEYVDASIARDLVRDRRAAGLSQDELARRAGVRPETISRLESGKHSPTARTLTKVERALRSSRVSRKAG